MVQVIAVVQVLVWIVIVVIKTGIIIHITTRNRVVVRVYAGTDVFPIHLVSDLVEVAKQATGLSVGCCHGDRGG